MLEMNMDIAICESLFTIPKILSLALRCTSPGGGALHRVSVPFGGFVVVAATELVVLSPLLTATSLLCSSLIGLVSSTSSTHASEPGEPIGAS